MQMTQQEVAQAFLQRAGKGNVAEAFAQFVAPGFIHHNQYFKGDAASLAAAMEQSSRESPNAAIEVKQIYEDGATVITHSRVTRADPAAPAIAVVHIFRFKDDKIVELWDIGQPILPDSPNENGLF
jgi:predicted SnoaL-like aldol condensation-catalyzing enzyme